MNGERRDGPRYPIHTVEQARYSLLCASRDYWHGLITDEEYERVRYRCQQRLQYGDLREDERLL